MPLYIRITGHHKLGHGCSSVFCMVITLKDAPIPSCIYNHKSSRVSDLRTQHIIPLTSGQSLRTILNSKKPFMGKCLLLWGNVCYFSRNRQIPKINYPYYLPPQSDYLIWPMRLRLEIKILSSVLCGSIMRSLRADKRVAASSSWTSKNKVFSP